MTQDLQVGIIGVNAERGWAREGHVPAVQALEGLALMAVATRDQRSADAAAAAFGVERAYGDAAGLIADEEVDVVTVAVAVPGHRDLVLAALRAGKHVVTEWPVGTSTAQTEELTAAGARSGVRTAVGLQGRLDPAVVRAVQLVQEGALGRVLHATAYSTTAGFGPTVAESELYLEDPATGMNLTTIQTAHTLDLAVLLAGPLTSVAARTTTQFPELEVGDPPRPGRRSVADHVVLHGRLADGGALTVQVAGGRPAGRTPFHLEVVGTDAVLTLVGGAPRGFQAGRLELRVDDRPVVVDAGERAGLADPVVNVAGIYAALRDDLRHGTSCAPGFGHAVRLSHLIDDVIAAAASGRSTAPSADWPTQP